jgi:hypothetical protein
MNKFIRTATIVPAALLMLGGMAALSPAIGRAAECGVGTVYDAPSNTCVVPAAPAAEPLPPPPPPPPWNGPTPYVSASICAPIPFVALCVGI